MEMKYAFSDLFSVLGQPQSLSAFVLNHFFHPYMVQSPQYSFWLKANTVFRFVNRTVVIKFFVFNDSALGNCQLIIPRETTMNNVCN